VSDVAFLDKNTDTGARNERRMAVFYLNTNSAFEVMNGVLDLVMTKVGAISGKDYSLKPSDNPMFFPKRGANVMYRGKSMGVIGVLHPEVLANFDLLYPVTCMEFNLETLFEHFKSTQN